MWVATQDLPRSAAHPFYARLNQILDQHDFDEFVEGLCERFYADEGRPSLPPGRYFRLLLIGYFEGLDAERAIAWRAAAAAPGRRRRRHVRRCTAIGGAFEARAVGGCCGCAASAWSVPSRSSTRLAACAACTCAGTRTF